jgi:hypothetical protein
VQSQYSAQSIFRAFAEIEDNDFVFVSDSGGIDLEGMHNIGLYLLRLSTAGNHMEEIQARLDRIDEPTQQDADDKAFDLMNKFVEEQPVQ